MKGLFKNIRLAGTAVLLLACLSGCGYHRLHRSAELPDWVRTIHVAPWENQSNELLLGAWITDELRQEFLRGGGLALSPLDQSDVILKGKIVEVNTSGLSYIRYDQAVERRINARCEVSLVDRRTGKLLWNTADIVREEGFLVGRDVMSTEGLKEEALRKLSRDVAEIVHHRVTGMF